MNILRCELKWNPKLVMWPFLQSAHHNFFEEDAVRNLGVIIDSELNVNNRLKAVPRPAHRSPENIARIEDFLSK